VRKTIGALALLLFLQFMGIGMFSIPLYTVLGRSPEAGGLGLTSSQTAVVAILGSLATLPALPLVRRMESARLSRRHALACALALNSLSAALTVFLVGARSTTNLAVVAAVTSGFSIFNTVAQSLAIAIVLESLPAASRVIYYPIRAAGSVGFIAASWWISFGLTAVSPQPFVVAAIIFGLLASLVATIFPLGREKPALQLVSDRMSIPGGEIVGLLSRCAGLFLVVFLNAILIRCFDINANPFLTDLKVPRAAAVQTRGVILEAILLAVAPWLFRSQKAQSRFIALGPAGWFLVFLAFRQATRDWHPMLVEFGLPFMALNCAFQVSASIFVSRTETQRHATAQSVLAVIQSLGTVTGSFLCGWLLVSNTLADGRVAWQSFWTVAAIAAFAVTIIGFCFRPRGTHQPPNGGDST
jgi:MFS family permease